MDGCGRPMAAQNGGCMREDYRDWSDGELIGASVSDAAPFRALYDRWADRLAAYFYRRTWDTDVTVDLVAETFAVAWRKRTTYQRRPQPGAAWWFGIARQERAMSRRHAAVRTRAVRRPGLRVGPWDADGPRQIAATYEVRPPGATRSDQYLNSGTQNQKMSVRASSSGGTVSVSGRVIATRG